MGTPGIGEPAAGELSKIATSRNPASKANSASTLACPLAPQITSGRGVSVIEVRERRVPRGQSSRFTRRPRNAKLRVVPADSARTTGNVRDADLVSHFRRIGERLIAVGAPDRNKH